MFLYFPVLNCRNDLFFIRIQCSLLPSQCLLYTFCRYYQEEARNVVHLKSENLGFANNYALREEYVKCINVLNVNHMYV